MSGSEIRGINMSISMVVISVSVLMFVLSCMVLAHLFKNRLGVRKRIDNMTQMQKINEKRSKKSLGGKLISESSKSKFFSGKFLKRLSNELSLAGVLLRPDEYIIIWIFSSLGSAGIAMVLTHEIFVALAFVISGAILPPFFLNRAKTKRFYLFEKQLVDALIIMGNCLRSGLSFQQAIESITRDMPEPISKEFGRAIREMKLGVPIEKALTNMMERIDSKDFVLMVSAVLIQRQVGGNLSEILDNIAVTIKDRLKIKSEIRILTATGRMSGIVIGVLPLVIALILMILNPDYIKTFFQSSMGTFMLVLAGGLELVGFLIVKKIVNIKF